MDDLDILAIREVEKIARVKAGRTKFLVYPNPPVGNHPNRTEKTKINTIPNQNIGVACPISTPIEIRKSNIESLFIAENIPAGIAMTNAIMKLAVVNKRVFKKYGLITSKTGS